MFLKCIKDCFEGKERCFSINGSEISKDYFDVYFVGETDTLDVEKNLSSKSYLKQEIKNKLNDIDEETLNNYSTHLNLLTDKINNAINVNNLSGIDFKIDIDVKDLINKNLVIYNENIKIDEMSFTKKRLKYIDLIIEVIMRYKKPTVLIIDELFLSLSKYNIDRFLDKFNNIEKDIELYLFISGSHNLINGYNPIYVLNNELRNTLIDDDLVYKYICFKNNCSLKDAKVYTNSDEILHLKDRMINKYDLESIFINGKEKWESFNEFYDYILNKLLYNKDA